MVICLIDELSYYFSLGVSDVVDISFPNERFEYALVKNFCFDFAHKYILAKATAILVPMAVPCVCR